MEYKIALDDSFAKPLFNNSCFLIHSKDSGKSQAVVAWNKTTKLLAQDGWQHRHSALDQIYAGSTFACISIQRSVGLDKVRDVSNVNTDFISSVVVKFYRHRVI